MKLRNLMYATMIACAFASCSKDDEITPDNNNPSAEGTFIEVRAQNPISQTKAAGDPTVEDAINTLTMVVFGSDNKVEAIETTTPGAGGAMSRKVAVSAGSKKVLMVANAPLTGIEVGSSYSDIAGLTRSRADENATNGFSMSSKLYDATVVLNTTTFLGYSAVPAGFTGNSRLETEDQTGVKLYRNVAKVVLTNVAVTNEKGDFTKYGNPNVVIKDVFIMNAKSISSIVPASGEKHWGAATTASPWLAGVEANPAWDNKDRFVLASTWTKADYFIDAVANTKIGYKQEEEDAAAPAKSTTAFNNTPFYVYENGSNALATASEKTLLVIKADVTYDTKDGRAKAEDRYYTLAIGRTGFDPTTTSVNGYSAPNADFPFANRAAEGAGINGADEGYAFDVLRNLQYNVSLTIKGMGYDQPGGGDPKQYLDVKVQVVAFGEVDQPVEI